MSDTPHMRWRIMYLPDDRFALVVDQVTGDPENPRLNAAASAFGRAIGAVAVAVTDATVELE